MTELGALQYTTGAPLSYDTCHAAAVTALSTGSRGSAGAWGHEPNRHSPRHSLPGIRPSGRAHGSSPRG